MLNLRDNDAMLLAGLIAVVAGTMARLLWRALSAGSGDPERQGPSAADPEQLDRAWRHREERSPGMGALCCVVAVGVWPVGLGVIVATRRAGGGVGQSIVIGFTAAFLPLASGLLWRRGRQLQVPIGDRAPLQPRRPQVLYLRPFRVDEFDRRNRAGHHEVFPKTTVERMQRCLRPIADLVSVGDPSDRLPPLGTNLVYPPGAWQEVVRELTAASEIVILPTYLLSGDQSGFAWEVEHVVGLGSPDRLILLLTPPGICRPLNPTRQESYEAFRDRFDGLFPHGLPEAIGTNNVLYFDADWTPQMLAYAEEPGVDLPDSCPDRLRSLVLHRLTVEFGSPRLERMRGFLRGRPPLQRVTVIAVVLLAGLFAVMMLYALLLSLTLIVT
jgi:hypothetical protein